MIFAEYPKIDSIFKRDKCGRFTSEYSRPEFAYLAELDWEWTEKIDGTNIRVHWIPDTTVTIGGRTSNAQIPVHLLHRLTKIFPSSMFTALPELILYGEGYGSKIQKGGKYIPLSTEENPDRVDFILFDVQIAGWWLKREDVEDIAIKLNTRAVPVCARFSFGRAVELVKKGFDSFVGDRPAEGLVGRTPIGLKDRAGRPLRTKIKTKDFKE